MLNLKQFEEKIIEIIEEYLADIDSNPSYSVLAVNKETHELEICLKGESNSECDTYKLSTLIRNNEDSSEKEPDIDSIHKVASTYLFVI